MLAELDFAMAYLDDIIIKSETSEQHKLQMKEVFKKLANLVSNSAWINANFLCQKLNTWSKLATQKVKDPTWKDLVRFGICPPLQTL